MKYKFVLSVFAAAGMLVLAACGSSGVQDTGGLDDGDLLTASDSVRIVSPSNIGPNSLPGGVWYWGGEFENLRTAVAYSCGYGNFVDGPATPPIGTGSVELNASYCGPTPTSQYMMGGIEILTYQFGGTKLADIRVLRYSTYVHASSGPNAQATVQVQSGGMTPSLQLDYSRNISEQAGKAVSYLEGRLIFVPQVSVAGQPVLLGRWQTWNTLVGKWWATGPLGSTCPQSSPCTLQQVLAAAPNLTIGVLAINLSGPMYQESAVSKLVLPIYESYKANADRLVIRKKGEVGNTVFNFERTCGADSCPSSNPSKY